MREVEASWEDTKRKSLVGFVPTPRTRRVKNKGLWSESVSRQSGSKELNAFLLFKIIFTNFHIPTAANVEDAYDLLTAFKK